MVGARRRQWRSRLSVRRQCRSGGLAVLAEIVRGATISPNTRISAAASIARRPLAATASKPACSSGLRGTPATGMWSRACSPPIRSAPTSAACCCRANRSDGLANAGPIVCACFGVGRNTICDAIAAGARSAADIGAKLKAGTNCGSCIPELKRLIAQAEPNDAGSGSWWRRTEVAIHVIASEAKQSISCRKCEMDCFVASLLAMTGMTIDRTGMSSMVHPFLKTDEPRK